MAQDKAVHKADIAAVQHRREDTSLMDPLVLGEGSRHRANLTDLALELAQKSAGLRRSLPTKLAASLADLVRSMNCYYSNLIEGHDTHPVDIERALKGDYSNDTRRSAISRSRRAPISPCNGGSIMGGRAALRSQPMPGLFPDKAGE